ncbi:MAG: MFS transporter [Chloroflexota bacterium]
MNRQILAWCLYDFANSSYSAVIAAVIFPVYYTGVIVGNETGQGDLWWGRAIALSMAFVAITSPFLGGIADYARIRKRFLILYTLLCVTAVSGLAFLRQGMVAEGFCLIVLANIGLEGGLVFYNSFLPEIAPRTYVGRVSAWGYGIGYAGSIVSLAVALALIQHKLLSATWIMVALFFALFSFPAFLSLPRDQRGNAPIVSAAAQGLVSTWRRLREILSQREQRTFLVAYLIYSDGINTIIVFSSIFASRTLGFSTEELVWLYITVQATALLGAFLVARTIDYGGPKRVVSMTLGLWSLVSAATYFVEGKSAFFGIASIAGLGLGSIQAASRAFYAQFIPEGEESEYFGVYSLVGKSSAILGPLLFGQLSATLGSQRPAILSVLAFFLAGFLVIRTVRGGAPNV